MSSELTMVVGVGAVNPLDVMRVPLTITVASSARESPRPAPPLAAGGPLGDGGSPLPAAVWPLAGTRCSDKTTDSATLPSSRTTGLIRTIDRTPYVRSHH